ncbi:hypothetical protein HYC85_008963 [Camellia sinensis]|uniref:Uncharacterized protein n=1 Tax=Camellia sinensis TaxID=4442 RepID=A0A7J7HUN6_CAMSI|nr:hypothetical protein HYC85_008963 [Camellia sinensis]
MLKLAKLLHHKGFHITFINTEFNHRRLLKSQGHHSISGTPSFRFETIPDGLPSSELDATQDIPALCHSILHNFLNPFRQSPTRQTQPSGDLRSFRCWNGIHCESG